jgi:SAM-dependent methyltransferase
VKAYYARRAAEYDATSWEAFDETERARVERFVASLPPVRTLDIGCGTGYLTRFLRGSVVGVDQSADVLELARARLPGAELVCADVPPLPFADGAFDLAFSSNVYSHIDTAAARAGFVAEALRVARALIVLAILAARPGARGVGAAAAARRFGVPRLQAVPHGRGAGARAGRRRRALFGRVRCRPNSPLPLGLWYRPRANR